MAPYRWQHYLPVAYLRHFAVDSSLPRSELRIWRCSGTHSHSVKVESQCGENYFYSKEHAGVVEPMFGEMEAFYADLIQKIKLGKQLSLRDSYGLILSMGDFHNRSRSYLNATGEENIHAYNIRTKGFLQMFTGKEHQEVTEDEFLAHLKSHWSTAILNCSGESAPLITSDNPSVFFAVNRDKPRLGLMLLPTGPGCLAIAFDHRVHKLSKAYLDQEDAGALNHIQCKSAIRSVYSFKELEIENRNAVREIFATRPSEHRGRTDGLRVDVPLFRYQADWRFSFLTENG